MVKRKSTNNDLQNTPQKCNDLPTQNPLKPEVRAIARERIVCSISGTRRVTLVTNLVTSNE